MKLIVPTPNGYTTIQEEGSDQTQRSTLNFVGTSVTVTDVASVTTVTIADSAGITQAHALKIASMRG